MVGGCKWRVIKALDTLTIAIRSTIDEGFQNVKEGYENYF
ncbi:variable large family protein (plasmid) [Borrelia miyamotoi]|uniref:Variable large protein n=1 Tax=Borrelia miyamotoi TaxID=47466 RepID=A0AAX3JQB0_9SPIR|nr:variable large family protein [Borrelia miyamotoi]WAZ72883.1 variable large family protein [Borrelia miyamotoi]WVI05713.1 variable large family protein [Borrelia miyamotoi]